MVFPKLGFVGELIKTAGMCVVLWLSDWVVFEVLSRISLEGAWEVSLEYWNVVVRFCSTAFFAKLEIAWNAAVQNRSFAAGLLRRATYVNIVGAKKSSWRWGDSQIDNGQGQSLFFIEISEKYHLSLVEIGFYRVLKVNWDRGARFTQEAQDIEATEYE